MPAYICTYEILRKTSYHWTPGYNVKKNRVPLYPRFTKLRKTGHRWTLCYNVEKNMVERDLWIYSFGCWLKMHFIISSFISNRASKIIQTNTPSEMLRKHPSAITSAIVLSNFKFLWFLHFLCFLSFFAFFELFKKI